MKYTKYILSAAVATLMLSSCDDNKMEWGTPDGQYPVTNADIPLAVKEVIANYDNIKTYADQYTPKMKIGVGFGADMYVAGGTYTDLVNANFQMATPGNAMKEGVLVSNTGKIDFTAVDAMLDQMKEKGIDLYGHNFIWHTQQNQTYLKSLIAPTKVIVTDSDIQSELSGDDSDFEGGSTGSWGSWGNSSSKDVASPGYEASAYCMHLTNPSDANTWSAQCAYTFDEPLDINTTYTIRFWAKCSSASGQLQFQYQNGTTYGSQGAYETFSVGTNWTLCEKTFTPEHDDANRIIINFGAVGAEYWIDNIEFGAKVEDPMDRVLSDDDYDFEKGTTGKWGSWGNSSTKGVASPGYKNSEYCMYLNNPTDANAWSAQCAYTFDAPLVSGTKYIIQFYAKSSSASGQLQFQYQNSTTYGSQGGYNTFDVGTDWVLCETEFIPTPEDVDRIILNFGAVSGDYYIDNVKFGPAKNQSSECKSFQLVSRSSSSRRSSARRRSATYYVVKSEQEKREILLNEMDRWINAVADHLKEKGVTPYGYDVLNEAITDGSKAPRGIKTEGVLEFNGEDTEPSESIENGLTLNWDDGHFYWGYYIGADYAAQAFKMARKALPDTKLFLNDYNLETSSDKRHAFMQFAKSIDDKAGETVVDGLGTQCHLTLDVSSDDSFDTQIENFMAQVDASLTDLASTGKLVRITELDIALGTATPSSTQLEAQYEAYRRVLLSYKKIVPEAQQSGVTIWGVSDNAKEHEYWLPDESPNLWDSSYLRKWAYKGVCDGIAGEDLGLKFNGNDYKAYYEKNNTATW